MECPCSIGIDTGYKNRTIKLPDINNIKIKTSKIITIIQFLYPEFNITKKLYYLPSFSVWRNEELVYDNSIQSIFFVLKYIYSDANFYSKKRMERLKIMKIPKYSKLILMNELMKINDEITMKEGNEYKEK